MTGMDAYMLIPIKIVAGRLVLDMDQSRVLTGKKICTQLTIKNGVHLGKSKHQICIACYLYRPIYSTHIFISSSDLVAHTLMDLRSSSIILHITKRCHALITKQNGHVLEATSVHFIMTFQKSVLPFPCPPLLPHQQPKSCKMRVAVSSCMTILVLYPRI